MGAESGSGEDNDDDVERGGDEGKKSIGGEYKTSDEEKKEGEKESWG